MDFPAVTVCNLNRVNCHNAFIAMYNLKTKLNDPSLTAAERNTTQESFNTTRILLSNSTSSCIDPVCKNIKSSLGRLYIKNGTAFNVKNSTILNLFMMLENGCDLNPTKPDDAPKEMYCQFLLMLQQNITDNLTKQRAAGFFQSVSIRLKTLNEEMLNFLIQLDCDLTEACEYCEEQRGQGGGGEGGPGGSGGAQQPQQKVCLNKKPENCSGLELIQSQGGAQNLGPGNRKKRSPAGSPDAPAPTNIINADKDAYAKFVKHLLSLPENIKRGIGHNLKKQWSVIEQQDRLGFIVNCDYKGINCSDER